MSDLLNDLERHRPHLNEVFERHGVVLAYLFGSQARGDTGPLSDVDVAVLFHDNVPKEGHLTRVLQLIGELGSLFGRDDVYVVNLAEASPLLAHRVYYDGKIMFCADEAQRVRFAARALHNYVDTEPLRSSRTARVRQADHRISATYGKPGVKRVVANERYL